MCCYTYGFFKICKSYTSSYNPSIFQLWFTFNNQVLLTHWVRTLVYRAKETTLLIVHQPWLGVLFEYVLRFMTKQVYNLIFRNIHCHRTIHQPVNCGATVPRVSLENFKDDNITGLYCSRTGSTLVFISSDAAYNTHFTHKLSIIHIINFNNTPTNKFQQSNSPH